jgi:hypothetical protein
LLPSVAMDFYFELCDLALDESCPEAEDFVFFPDSEKALTKRSSR